jgi:hypothetical protein
LVLIENTDGDKFGGFTSLCFDSTTSNYKTGGNNFLFSLNKMKKYSQNEGNYSIYCHPNYGPTFGGGHDITVAENGNLKTNHSNLKNSYGAND